MPISFHESHEMQLNSPEKHGLGAIIVGVDYNTHVWKKHWIDQKKFGDHKLGMHDNLLSHNLP
jgi:hypothetical protein